MNDTDVNWQQILGGLAGAGGLAAGISGANNQTGILQNALSAIGPTNLGSFSLNGPGGSSSSFSGGQSNVNLGALNPAYNNLAQYGANTTGNTPDLSSLLQQITGANGMAGNNLVQANNGFQNGLQGSAYGGAQTAINGLGAGYNSTYNSALSALQSQQQPGNLLQANQLQDSLFGSGNLGSSAGGLASAAFGRGIAQQNSSNALTAQQLAQGQQNQQLGVASGLTSIGQNTALTGNSLLSSAFNNFGSMSGLQAGTTTQNLNNGLGAISGANGINSGALAQLQAALAAPYATAAARNGSLAPYANAANNLAGTPTSTSLLGGALSSFANGSSNGTGSIGAMLGAGSSVSNMLAQLFGGGSSTATTQTNDPGGFQGLFNSMGSGGSTTNFEDPNYAFSGASGQAANGSSSNIFGSLGSGLSDAASGLGVIGGVERGGVGGYGSAAASGANLLGATGVLGPTASNAVGTVGNALSGNYLGAARSALGTYGAATAQAGETTAQAAAESAAAQSGGAASGATAGGVAGALSSFVPAYLAVQLGTGLLSGTGHPINAVAGGDAQAWTNDFLNQSGPGLQSIAGDGSTSPMTVNLKDGTQITGGQYQTLTNMTQKFIQTNNGSNGALGSNKGLTADQTKQLNTYISSVATKQPTYSAQAIAQSAADGKAAAAMQTYSQNAMQQAFANLGYNPYSKMVAH